MKRLIMLSMFILLLPKLAFAESTLRGAGIATEHEKQVSNIEIPFYMVIIGAANSKEEAEKLASELWGKPGVVFNGDYDYLMDGNTGSGIGIYETSLWKGLEPGYFVIADGLFVNKEEAEKLKAELETSIPDVYIKKVINPKVKDILFVADDMAWVIWSGLGFADFEHLHFTNLKEEQDIELCWGRRRPTTSGWMVHTFDPEIEPLTVDREKECFYFYDNGFKVFYFAANKPRDTEVGRKTIIKIENAVRKEIGDPEADVQIRWVIENKACASVYEPLEGDEAQALTDLQHHRRTLFYLTFQDDTWRADSKKDQAYKVTTVCYH